MASKLTISIPSSSTHNNEFDFSDIFEGDQQVIHHRTHSFVGPTPRYNPNYQTPRQEIMAQISDDEDIVQFQRGCVDENGGFVGPSPRVNPNYPTPCREIMGQVLDDEDKVQFQRRNFIEQVVCMGESGGLGGKLGPNDFEILRVVGKGAFGKVFLVRKKGKGCDDGVGDELFAMKVMRKDQIIKRNHVDYMKAERDILTKVVHPFIVQLRYSFQFGLQEKHFLGQMWIWVYLTKTAPIISIEIHLFDYSLVYSFIITFISLQTKSKLYLILDFINGGHLFFHLYRQGIFSEDQARLYTAEIVSAVSHLHKNGIVHRDLKPENILMDADGHVVLTDFGLAKEIDESSRTNSLCGTMEYMAPEIIQAKGHNQSADWWSIGILLYEMLTGQPPFIHPNRQKLQQRIINEKVKLPPMLTSEAHSLLKGLLHKDPTKRLGSGPKGADEIKNHKWFRTINWKKLEARELKPKFKPEVNGDECTANFDKCWTTMPPNDSPAPTPTGDPHFEGYTYVAPNPWLSSS